MTFKFCYGCNQDLLLREFYGPKEHKNDLCSNCFDKATGSSFRRLGFTI